ncbi:MAG: L-threonylcarbamoyladenylate synthase [Candidatus Bruticola sp.]
MIVVQYDQDPETITQAVQKLRSGGVIIYPTDTLYGIGCDALNPQAINRVYNIKKLNKRKPLSLLCCDLSQISKYAHVNQQAYTLLRRLLPGPYTFILPATKLVPRVVVNKQRKVGIRVPDNEVCLNIIRELGSPLMNTSASYETDEEVNDPEVIKTYYRDVDMLIDCGPAEWSQSSIIDLSGSAPSVIRYGKGDVESALCIVN